MTVPAGAHVDAGFLTAFVAYIPWPVMRGKNLRDRRNPSRPQAAAADHEFVEAVQQSIVDIVLAVRGHVRSPRVHGLFVAVGMAKDQRSPGNIAGIVNWSRFRM